jgi:hypothetical protein
VVWTWLVDVIPGLFGRECDLIGGNSEYWTILLMQFLDVVDDGASQQRPNERKSGRCPAGRAWNTRQRVKVQIVGYPGDGILVTLAILRHQYYRAYQKKQHNQH